jgi:tetratricopeptide (TPR) repeat protein
MLFEMLCGRRPFEGTDQRAVQHTILHDDPPDVRSIRAGVPAELVAIVSRALRKSPGDRLASAAEMASALRSALATQDPAGKSPTLSLLPRSRRGTFAAVAVVAVAGVVALAALWTGRSAPPASTTLGTANAAVDDLVARARERDGSGSPQGVEEAIRLLHNVLGRDSGHAPAHALLARAYVRSTIDGMSRQGVAAWIDPAIVHARRAIALAPRSPDGYTALGFAYASTIRHGDAVREYLRALELDPAHAQTMMDLARSYMALDRFDEAVTWQERALAREPTLPGARVLVVARYMVWDLLDHATRHLKAGLALTPTDVSLLMHAMYIDVLAGDTASARRRYDAMLPLLSSSQRSMLGATIEMQLGNLVAARRHVDRIVAAGATSQEYIMFGQVYRETGDRVRGDSLLRLRIAALRVEDRRTNHRSTQVAASLGHAYAVLGQRDSALIQLARWDWLGGGGCRARLLTEPGWRTLRGDPRWEAIVARMDARFHAARDLMRARLARDLPTLGKLGSDSN